MNKEIGQNEKMFVRDFDFVRFQFRLNETRDTAIDVQFEGESERALISLSKIE
jgi:hypothetical protein